MEKSHQKVLIQMRRAHKRELDAMRLEKEQVLDEETKATQAGACTGYNVIAMKAGDKELKARVFTSACQFYVSAHVLGLCIES